MWKDFLAFSKNERRGIIVIIALALIFYAASKLIFLFENSDYYDIEQHKETIAQFEALMSNKDSNYFVNRLNRNIIARYDSLELFDFDPNVTTKEQWKKLGLTHNQITNIENYIAKGGRFYEPEDFQKIYRIRQMQYSILKPFIKINVSKPKKDSYNNKIAENTPKKEVKPKFDLFEFDPNTISAEEWQRLGIKNRISSRIKKYLSKGGRFLKNEDLKKIYGLNTADYERLEPYIRIKQKSKKENTELKGKIKIELNTASEKELKSLYGIGNYYAAQIVKYRKELGGFHNISQLMEIPKFRQETIEKIKDYIKIDLSQLRHININNITIKTLVAHPYFDYAKASLIVEYRKKNGEFKSINDLLENNLLLKKDYDKVKPYLKL